MTDMSDEFKRYIIEYEKFLSQHVVWQMKKDIEVTDGVFPKGLVVKLSMEGYYLGSAFIKIKDLAGTSRLINVNSPDELNDLFECSDILDDIYRKVWVEDEDSGVRLKKIYSILLWSAKFILPLVIGIIIGGFLF